MTLFKGIDFFPHGVRWNIVGQRKYFIGLSVALIALSALLLVTRGLNYGVDFKGGSLIEVQSKAGPLDIGAIRTKLNGLGLGDIQVQGVGGGAEALIRIAQQAGQPATAGGKVTEKDLERAQAEAGRAVIAALGEGISVRRQEVVGPTVSSELKRTGIYAVVASMLGILIYLWFRFEWQFAVAGIVALIHDVFITTGMFSLLWIEFDLSVVAALLTLAGYSINDTVVVFDRIRENLRRYKKMPLIELLNLSINETLSRTVLTSVTVFLAVLALYLFGTEVIHGFSFAMLFGIIIGTYSSIFVAASLLLWLGIKREGWSGVKEPAGAARSGAVSAGSAAEVERAAASAAAGPSPSAGRPGPTSTAKGPLPKGGKKAPAGARR